MKKIYIVITQTGTIVSRIIKLVTEEEYCHASIAIEPSLNKMYSFARKNKYIPFIGAFVIEEIFGGTYERFKMTKCKVISIEVTDEQYEVIEAKLLNMEKNKEKYKYNFLGFFLAGINKNIHGKNKFYCSEFVKYILETANIDISLIPKVVHPIHFLDLQNKDIEYEGILRKYKAKCEV